MNLDVDVRAAWGFLLETNLTTIHEHTLSFSAKSIMAEQNIVKSPVLTGSHLSISTHKRVCETARSQTLHVSGVI